MCGPPLALSPKQVHITVLLRAFTSCGFIVNETFLLLKTIIFQVPLSYWLLSSVVTEVWAVTSTQECIKHWELTADIHNSPEQFLRKNFYNQVFLKVVGDIKLNLGAFWDMPQWETLDKLLPPVVHNERPMHGIQAVLHFASIEMRLARPRSNPRPRT